MPDSTTRRILTSAITATPWKNGGGVTREIATGQAADSGGGTGWGWRVSLAEVAQDGPFSIFPGTDRVIAVIDGAGMDLISPEGEVIALEPFQAVRLDGEAPLEGRLRQGPVRDLNVMVRRAEFRAEMEIHQGPWSAARRVDDRDCLVVHALTGPCRVRLGSGEVHDLAPSETLVHEGGESFDIEVAKAGRAAVIHIEPR